MSETHRINSQLKRAYQGEAWHGPSLRELLADVTAAQAAAKPVPTVHSIWELAHHIIAWETVVRRRLAGEVVTDIPDEVNFPVINDASEAAWQESLQALAASNQALRDSIKQFDETRLDEIVPGMNYSHYFMLHGTIQHDLYHAGQIALLKKLVA